MSKVIDPALFRETLGHYPTGLAVVTAIASGASGGEPIGMVVGTFSGPGGRAQRPDRRVDPRPRAGRPPTVLKIMTV